MKVNPADVRRLSKQADDLLKGTSDERLIDQELEDEKIKKIVTARQERKLGKVVAFLKSGSAAFEKACEVAKVKVTRRQASKWLMHKGAAWKAK
jgi:hypothetical protein